MADKQHKMPVRGLLTITSNDVDFRTLPYQRKAREVFSPTCERLREHENDIVLNIHVGRHQVVRFHRIEPQQGSGMRRIVICPS